MGDVKGVGGKKSEEGQAEGPVAEPMGPELPCVMAMLGSGSGYFIVGFTLVHLFLKMLP